MRNEAQFLMSEINELEAILASIPAENVIDRMSFEARLAAAQQALAQLPQQLTSKAKLTFRGKPVFGSHGITADFGSKAAGLFSDAFAAVSVGLREGLRDMGPIPNRDKNQLLITGTAIGSFGFVFELPVPELALFPEQENPQIAIEKIEALFRLAATGSDDEVAEVIEEVHPRAVKKVYDFLELLVQQQAWCGLEFEGRAFRYADYEQLKISCERLKDENIHEQDETYQGKFEGVLPTGRTFEFRLADPKSVIKGKIDRAIDDPDVLNRDWLHKPVAAKFHVMQVGKGRPRFTLKSINDLST